MKNTFLICLFTLFAFVGCVDDEADFTGGGNIDVEMPTEPDPDAVIDEKVFEVINLDYPGLEKAKTAYEAGDKYTALVKLLNYYRTRVDVVNRNVNLFNPTVTDTERNIADQALEYKFYVKNYAASSANGIDTYYSFKGSNGTLINWDMEVINKEDPSKNLTIETAQEFFYQRHRHQWMLPQAKAYAVTKDERYIQSWKTVYQDWLNTYPYEAGTKFPTEGGSENNVNYQWKGLQVAERVISQIDIMAYFIQSNNFTPEWLSVFLANFAKQVECIRTNYYQQGNILLTQAQAVAMAGILMPEFSNAGSWATEGATKMTEQVGSQFLSDGVQIELDPSYHISAISDAYEAYLTAADNNKSNLFSAAYLAQLEKPAKFVMDITYPNYSLDNFNDTRSSTWTKSVLQKNFRKYVTMFPGNTDFQYMANGGGTTPGYLIASYPVAGYYVLRNGWKETDAMMIVKNNNDPNESWHCQSDNGTFGLYYNGRNFFPDAGVYAYSGTPRINYAAAKMHNTLTVQSKGILDSERNGKLLQLKEENGVQILVTQNDGIYDGGTSDNIPLKYRRSVFHDVSNKLFIIVDEAAGEPTYNYNTNLSFHLCPDAEKPVYDEANKYCTAYTNFSNGGNMMIRTFFDPDAKSQAYADVKSDFTSNNIGESIARPGYMMTCKPNAAGKLIRFISVISLGEGDMSNKNIAAEFVTTEVDVLPATTTVKVTVDGNEHTYTYDLNSNN